MPVHAQHARRAWGPFRRPRWWRALAAAALGAALLAPAAPAHAAGTAAPRLGPDLGGAVETQPGALMRLSFRAGDVHRYAYTTAITSQVAGGPAVTVDLDLRLSLAVDRVFPDQSAAVTGRIDRIAATLAGNPLPLADVTRIVTRMRVQPSGASSDVSIEGLPELGALPFSPAQFATNLMGFQYPPQRVLVGDHFERERELPLGAAGGLPPAIVHDTLTVAELTVAGGRRMARLVESVDVPSLQFPIAQGTTAGLSVTGTTTHWIDVETGWAASGEGTSTAHVTLSGDALPAPTTVTVQTSLSYQAT